MTSLDHDRILRQYLALIDATRRTNYSRRESPGGADGPPYLVLKLDPEAVPGLTGRPKFEIFAYSPRFEAVHLRFGRVARGGLRWYERPEDFRAELLRLAKAHIAAMLDVTDNIEVGQVVPPPAVVRRDGDDPYLVVAADHGTATYSDVANEIGARYGFSSLPRTQWAPDSIRGRPHLNG